MKLILFPRDADLKTKCAIFSRLKYGNKSADFIFQLILAVEFIEIFNIIMLYSLA